MDIAVIGSGIGGLASAIFLAKQGHQITVYEQAAIPVPVGAGFLLQPPGQNVLAKLGLAEIVSKEAIPIHGLKSKTLSGRLLLDLNYKDLSSGNLVGWGVQRSNIFDALYSTASKIDLINFKWGSHVDECKNQSNQAIVSIGTESHGHDLCILSSGTHSVLADQLFQNRVKRKYPWGCLWTTLRLPEEFSADSLQQRCRGSSKMMGILPVRRRNNEIDAALYWSMPVKSFDRFDSEATNAVKCEMADFWPELQRPIQLLSRDELKCASYNDVWTPNPINKRIIALGDVCHGTSPQLGQGCTMALLDALSLSMCISECDVKVERALSVWWAMRRKQLFYVRLMSKLLTPLYQSNTRTFGLLRDNLMAPIGRLPGLYKLELKTLASEVFLDHRLV